MTTATQTAKQLGDSVWLERAVRVGLLAYGVVHLLIGWLALQLALGDRSGKPSQQGALHELAAQPGGQVLLWVTGCGLFALAVWQVTDAVWGHRKHDEPKRSLKRLGSAGKAAVYVVLGFSAVRMAVGAGGGSSQTQLTARLMRAPMGRPIVAAIGIVIVIVAIVHVKRGITKSFEDDLDAGATSGSSGTLVVRAAQVGYPAKGVALGVVGALFVWAAWTYKPKKAGGLDTALRTLLDQSLRPWLLGAVALGIVCFGLYCFAWARYADTSS